MSEVEGIKIISISPVLGRGALKAFVEIQVGQFVFTDCRIIKENGKNAWVSMPTISYKNQHGSVCYKPLVKINDESLKSEISRAVIDAWEKNGSGGKNEKRDYS